MKQPRIILVTGAASMCSTQREWDSLTKLKRYLSVTGNEVTHTHSNGWTRAFNKAKAAITKKPIATPLDSATERDIIIGVGAGCRCLVDAAAKQKGPLRLILIEPQLPESEVLPPSVNHLLLFFNTALRGGTMGADGHWPKETSLHYEVKMKNIPLRDLHHYTTWLWREILRSRLEMNQRILSNGA